MHSIICFLFKNCPAVFGMMRSVSTNFQTLFCFISQSIEKKESESSYFFFLVMHKIFSAATEHIFVYSFVNFSSLYCCGHVCMRTVCMYWKMLFTFSNITTRNGFFFFFFNVCMYVW